ncbi:hypothetical protein HLB44_03600 [Aquincola sp. S2]|uniref:DUF2335 domain-containing protein n=1 Tax=Pseudaquabacterium terrae TaxID=2732868 RepID=A0ABX2EAF2_9BURK|nr:hypothetical protein [Aquabacterium terrae]NRF66069.1 hypothetical protein [Aquabacterium terrae]
MNDPIDPGALSPQQAALERRLTAALAALAEPLPDDGFSARVLQALPPSPALAPPLLPPQEALARLRVREQRQRHQARFGRVGLAAGIALGAVLLLQAGFAGSGMPAWELVRLLGGTLVASVVLGAVLLQRRR